MTQKLTDKEKGLLREGLSSFADILMEKLKAKGIDVSKNFTEEEKLIMRQTIDEIEKENPVLIITDDKEEG